MFKSRLALALVFCIGVTSMSCGQPPRNVKQTSKLTPQISWYGVLDDGLAEAKRTGRPILLISAACQCAGVPGMW